MKFYEYGDKVSPAIMLIHGGGNSKWMFERAALILMKEYHVIVPELDGHGAEKNEIYQSTKVEADKIIKYINEYLDGKLYCIAGASLGSQIAMEVLGRKPDQIEKAFLESGICRPKKVTAKMMSWKWMLKSMKVMVGWTWMVKLQCRYSGWPLELADKIAEDAKAVSIESNYNLYKTYFNYNLPQSLKETSANVLLLYGSKESMMMKKDVRYALENIKGSRLKVLEGYNHCGCSLGNTEKYVDESVGFLNEK